MNWQRTNVPTAAAYIRDRIASGADDVRTKAVYEGLLDVLEPAGRRGCSASRADSVKAAVVVQTARERRNRNERRRGRDRRTAIARLPGGVDRRREGERRRTHRRG